MEKIQQRQSGLTREERDYLILQKEDPKQAAPAKSLLLFIMLLLLSALTWWASTFLCRGTPTVNRDDSSFQQFLLIKTTMTIAVSDLHALDQVG